MTEQCTRINVPAKRDVIGIYGVPGSGKSFLLNELRQRLPAKHFSFHEGSFVISQLIDGGLKAFGDLPEPTKTIYRKYAIGSIREQCINSGSTGIVAGHATFWPEGGQPTDVYTEDDLATFGHIIYLDVPSNVVAQRRADDQDRARTCLTVEHLRQWQAREKSLLRRMCLKHGILFSVLGSSGPTTLSDETSQIIRDYRFLTDEQNILQATKRLDQALDNGAVMADTVLLLDGDRTLAPDDTGELFWRNLTMSQGHDMEPLKELFSGPLGYSSDAFRQANRLYEEAGSDGDFHKLCVTVASQVTLYPEILALFKQAEKHRRVRVIVLTCGLAKVWEKVMERAGLRNIAVFGGGRHVDEAVIMTPEVKGALVRHIQKNHRCKVIALGDSPLDMPMLARADEAIVVVGHEQTRSQSMEVALSEAISSGILQARQCLLPKTVSPRLNTARLPIVDITCRAFLQHIFGANDTEVGSDKLNCLDSNIAKLLMTPTRDAKVFGPALRAAHQRVGNILATSLITGIFGLEEYPIQHVQGHETIGYRLMNEQRVLLVALMRGGEPLAMGVNDAFPLAMFVHAKHPSDLLPDQMKEQKVVMLIDSVVNSGKTVLQFLRRVRALHSDVSVLVVAGVIQSEAIAENGVLGRALVEDRNLRVVALRTSNNKFTGSGTTDTGNRLYNSTYMP